MYLDDPQKLYCPHTRYFALGTWLVPWARRVLMNVIGAAAGLDARLFQGIYAALAVGQFAEVHVFGVGQSYRPDSLQNLILLALPLLAAQRAGRRERFSCGQPWRAVCVGKTECHQRSGDFPQVRAAGSRMSRSKNLERDHRRTDRSL